MKLLDPFSGLSLARGSYVYHCAFFSASWFINTDNNPYAEDYVNDRYRIEFAFRFLQLAHGVIIISEISNEFFTKFGGRESSSGKTSGSVWC
jgi:hypothetical protein